MIPLYCGAVVFDTLQLVSGPGTLVFVGRPARRDKTISANPETEGRTAESVFKT
jgi:hypothetical protein